MVSRAAAWLGVSPASEIPEEVTPGKMRLEKAIPAAKLTARRKSSTKTRPSSRDLPKRVKAEVVVEGCVFISKNYNIPGFDQINDGRKEEKVPEKKEKGIKMEIAMVKPLT